jgi:D-sedoheptulose 7-phosphate isomerase
VARTKGLVTVGMTGRSGGQMAAECDHCLRSASDCTPRIQEGHISIGHTLCWLIEQRMFPRC